MLGDGSLVSLFTWTKPIKSISAIIALNAFFWFLANQRPLLVFSLAVLVYYLKYLWKCRIQPEVLVDPPDQESWVTLSSYNIEYITCSFGRNLWTKYWTLRSESHISWTIASCLIFYFLGKIGSNTNLLCLMFILSNAAFCIGPFLKYLPDVTISTDLEFDHDETRALIPDEATAAGELWSAKEDTPEPESLTPYNITSMPDHLEDSEDEFLFDAKHFESSSSSSASNSFEFINT